ncbi:MAG: extracellular solute-binding protein [Erysipelotrichaceae bacterium]|nr:extracellular solute-binding protein [Erysipelotrichaceae bacterium]
MKKTVVLLMSALLCVCFLCGCRQSNAEPEPSVITGEVTIYTSHSEAEQQLFTAKFHELYPEVTINWVYESLAESIERLEAEKDDPQCDVLMGGLTQSDGGIYNHLFEQYTPYRIEEQSVIDEDHYYQYYTFQVLSFLVNKVELAKVGFVLSDIKGYTTLLHPQLTGLILSADPATTYSGYRQLTSILAIYGDGDISASSNGWLYVRNLLKNMDGVFTSRGSDVTALIDSGEYAVGLSYESVCVQRQASRMIDVDVVYPEEGNTRMAYAAAMVKNCKNRELAGKVIDYLLSKEYGEERVKLLKGCRATNTRVTTSGIVPDLSELNMKELDVEAMIKNREEILAKYYEIWEELGGTKVDASDRE